MRGEVKKYALSAFITWRTSAALFPVAACQPQIKLVNDYGEPCPMLRMNEALTKARRLRMPRNAELFGFLAGLFRNSFYGILKGFGRSKYWCFGGRNLDFGSRLRIDAI